MCPRAQSGFSIVAAIFIVVVLAALAAALLTVSGLQHSGSALDVQGLRAYQAARSGAQWGLYRMLEPDAAPSPALPSCWAGSATVTPGGQLAAFTVAATCSAATTTELGRSVGVYTINAVASFGTPGQPNHVSRDVTVKVSRCKDPGNAPDFGC